MLLREVNHMMTCEAASSLWYLVGSTVQLCCVVVLVVLVFADTGALLSAATTPGKCPLPAFGRRVCGRPRGSLGLPPPPCATSYPRTTLQ